MVSSRPIAGPKNLGKWIHRPIKNLIMKAVVTTSGLMWEGVLRRPGDFSILHQGLRMNPTALTDFINALYVGRGRLRLGMPR